MDARTRRLLNGVIAVVFLLIGITIAVGLLTRRTQGSNFTIVFKDAKGLPIGSPVTLRGLRIGEVTRVALAKDGEHIEVDVRIEAAYAEEIPAPPGVSARIKKSLFLPGNYSVALTIHKGAEGRMPQGARINGVESWIGEKTFEAKDAVKRSYRATIEKTSDKIDQLKDWWKGRGEKKEAAERDDEMRKLLERLENIDEDDPRGGIEALRLQAGELAKKRRQQGLDEEAEQLEDIAEVLAEYEKAAAEHPPEPSPSPARTRRTLFRRSQ